MNIVLATGIYPPAIGGPATYARALAEKFSKRGMKVIVVVYTAVGFQSPAFTADIWEVVRVSDRFPILRWWRYARELRKHAASADVVLAFSLVSCGIPLWMARLRKPKKVLRLGGDFLWERYTDLGGAFGLREWYESRFWRSVGSLARWLVGSLLRSFDYVVFSTRFQEEIYGEHYRHLPPHSVIENALPAPILAPAPAGEGRTRRTPFRLLFMGRFVQFKNLPVLIAAVAKMPDVALTMVGDGPLSRKLQTMNYRLRTSVQFFPPAHGPDKQRIFAEHDLLVLPSFTEISPNVALEARAAGLPALLTEETGLSEKLRRGMVIRRLRTAEQIRDAIREAMESYEHVVREAAQPVVLRGWDVVAGEYVQLFDRAFHLSLVAPHPNPLPRGEGSLLMISGDRSLASGKRGAFWPTLEELRKHWERIDVICPRREDESHLSTSIFPNVFVHPSPRGLWYQSLWILRKGKELLRQRPYAVMTVHDYPPFYNGLGAWLLYRSTDIPWIAEIHHVVGYPAAVSVVEWIGRRMYPLYFRTIGRSAAAFRVVNAGVGEFLARHGVRLEHIRLVPSFYLDHELLQADPSIPKKYDVVFCGRLVANKGVEELMEAMATMTQLPRLLVIGDGPLGRVLKTKNDKLQTHVTFTGWLPTPRDVYRAIQSAKVFVMCSKSEGGPRTALEAMALGLPVIATHVGVMPEVIEDGVNGLFTTGDPGDIAKKIPWLLADDQLRTRMGTEAKKVLGRFEKRRLIRQYADFLRSFA